MGKVSGKTHTKVQLDLGVELSKHDRRKER